MSTATRSPEDPRERLLHRLAESAYRRGQFTLASGRSSEHYVNCKPVSLSGTGLVLISTAMLENVEVDAVAVAGLTLGADPLVSGVAMAAALQGRDLNALNRHSSAHQECSFARSKPRHISSAQRKRRRSVLASKLVSVALRPRPRHAQKRLSRRRRVSVASHACVFVLCGRT